LIGKETAHQTVRIPTRHPPADTRDLVECTAEPKTEAKPGASGEAGLEIGMQSVGMTQHREPAAWSE